MVRQTIVASFPCKHLWIPFFRFDDGTCFLGANAKFRIKSACCQNTPTPHQVASLAMQWIVDGEKMQHLSHWAPLCNGIGILRNPNPCWSKRLHSHTFKQDWFFLENWIVSSSQVSKYLWLCPNYARCASYNCWWETPFRWSVCRSSFWRSTL